MCVVQPGNQRCRMCKAHADLELVQLCLCTRFNMQRNRVSGPSEYACGCGASLQQNLLAGPTHCNTVTSTKKDCRLHQCKALMSVVAGDAVAGTLLLGICSGAGVTGSLQQAASLQRTASDNASASHQHGSTLQARHTLV